MNPISKYVYITFLLLLITITIKYPLFAQRGDHIIRYIGEDKTANTAYHDGQMRPAIGTHN